MANFLSLNTQPAGKTASKVQLPGAKQGKASGESSHDSKRSHCLQRHKTPQYSAVPRWALLQWLTHLPALPSHKTGPDGQAFKRLCGAESILTSYPLAKSSCFPFVCTRTHHNFLAVGTGTFFLIGMVFVDVATGIWSLSEEEKAVYAFQHCACVHVPHVRPCYRYLVFFCWKRMGATPCRLQHYRHDLLPCLAVLPVIKFYVRAQHPFSVSDNVSVNFG